MSTVEQPPSSPPRLGVATHSEHSMVATATSGHSPVHSRGTSTPGAGFSTPRSMLSSDVKEMQRKQKRDQRRVLLGFIIAAIGIFCIVITVILLLSKSHDREKDITTAGRKDPKVLVENVSDESHISATPGASDKRING